MRELENETIALLVNLVMNDKVIKGLQSNVDEKTLNELLENKLNEKIELVKSINLLMMVDKNCEERKQLKTNIERKVGMLKWELKLKKAFTYRLTS